MPQANFKKVEALTLANIPCNSNPLLPGLALFSRFGSVRVATLRPLQEPERLTMMPK